MTKNRVLLSPHAAIMSALMAINPNKKIGLDTASILSGVLSNTKLAHEHYVAVTRNIEEKIDEIKRATGKKRYHSQIAAVLEKAVDTMQKNHASSQNGADTEIGHAAQTPGATNEQERASS